MTYLLLSGAATVSSLCAILCILLTGTQRISRMARPLSLMATGLLITLALTHILPEAMHEAADPHTAGMVCFVTVMVLIFVEMFFNTGHSHHHHPDLSACTSSAAPNGKEGQTGTGGALGLIAGTGLHTFCDGIMLAAAFAADPHVGLAVTMGILAHELPQEIGDYALLLTLGFSRSQAFVINITALLCMLTGALSFSYLIGRVEWLLPYALSVSAASFMYVALSDLLPRLNRSEDKKRMLRRYAFLLAGAVLALLISHHH